MIRSPGFLTPLCLLALAAATVSLPASAQISISTWGQGGVRIGTSTTTCNGSAEGALRYNSVSDSIQYCNGTSWGGLGSATPASPDRSIQFNDAGALGGSADLVFSSVSHLGVGTNAPKALLHVDGEAILGNTGLACSGTTEGALRWDATDNVVEMCNGTDWTLLVASVPTVLLVISPATSTGMNVDGGCGNATCYGSNVAFTVQNQGSLTSASMVSSLTNTTYFEFVSDTCNGNTLAPNQTCTITVRPKSTGNISYTGNLQVTANNNPVATLSGTASNFSCAPGRIGGGGIYASCNVSGSYDLVVTPGGCPAITNNPTCSGTDSITWAAAPQAITGVSVGYTASSTNGAQNTVDAMAYSGLGMISTPYAYCADLVYGGYSDWYVPATVEFQTYISPNRVAIGGFAVGYYHGRFDGNGYCDVTLNTGSIAATNGCFNAYYLRCARRHNIALPSPVSDTTPTAFTFSPTVAAASTLTTSSNAITVSSVTQAVSVSVSGSGSPEFSVNGGAWTSSANVTNGDQIRLRATSGAAGSERTITLTVGATSGTWKLRAPATGTIRAFITSTTYNGSGSGFTTFDGYCNTRAAAAGLGGTWVAMMAAAGTNLFDRIPWNWTSFTNMNGEVVGTSVGDLSDGTWSAAINRDEFNVRRDAYAWTGTADTQGNGGGGSWSCSNWTSGSSGINGYNGYSPSQGSGAIYNSATLCNNTYSVYCVESVTGGGGSDGAPNAFTFNTTYTTASNLVTSNTITVTGIDQSVAVTVSGSGTPEFRINGGSWVTSGNVVSGNTVQVRTTSGSAGTERAITVNIGSGADVWQVRVPGTATKRIFVTSTTTNGNLNGTGGIGGGNAMCSARANAVGLGTGWSAIVSTTASAFINESPSWNWNILNNMNGELVATSLPDLFDGIIMNPINRDESNVVLNTSVWGNTSPTTGFPIFAISGYNCGEFTSNSGAFYSQYGRSGSTGTAFTSTDLSGCNSTFSLYCIEN